MKQSQQSRRNFIKTSALASALAISPWSIAQSRRVQSVGLQLYTLRAEMAQDFAGTLAQVAALGYREMEFAGYFNKPASEVRSILDRLGLTSPAAHIQIQALRDNLQKEIDSAVALGQQYIVVPNIVEAERSIDHFHQHAEFLNRAGEVCQQAGIKIGYHNHSFEFMVTDGQVPYDILLAETDPTLVAMEMDLYWIRYAGVDPVPYFQQHPGRFPMLHVKDMDAERNMRSVGQGSIDFAQLFSFAEVAGFQHYFIEHDSPENGLQSVTDSINAVRALVF